MEEYKKSVITEAVTKGLNPDAEMKESGIEWIGKIPINWQAVNPRWLLLREKIRLKKVWNNILLHKNMVLYRKRLHESYWWKYCYCTKDLIFKMVCKGDLLYICVVSKVV